MNIGCTATRQGLTKLQALKCRAMLRERFAPGAFFVHGDCVGGDAQLAEIARAIGYTLVARPCHLVGQRAFVPSDIAHPPSAPLVRNRKIVNDCETLLSAPASRREELRSGTWATMRYARKTGRVIYAVDPLGSVFEDWR